MTLTSPQCIHTLHCCTERSRDTCGVVMDKLRPAFASEGNAQYGRHGLRGMPRSQANSGLKRRESGGEEFTAPLRHGRKIRSCKPERGYVFRRNPLKLLVRLAGIEPTTPWFVGVLASQNVILINALRNSQIAKPRLIKPNSSCPSITTAAI
jgi:hypothetical protein